MSTFAPTSRASTAPDGNSRPVYSAQTAPHDRLEEIVRRHLETPWQTGFHPPSVDAFKALQSMLSDGESQRLVLDSGCGTGESTRALAARYPDCVVIGVDQSASRLARSGVSEAPLRRGNCVLLRSGLETFWRLTLTAGWKLRRHYLLYPNPWPKRAHLRRRWHGHPVFPEMLALGGRLVLRTNWRVYAEEFALAVGQVRGEGVVARPIESVEGLSPFERKYEESGHRLWEVTSG